MRFLDLGSIARNLTFIVVMAVLPALAILFYTGMEQRRLSIEKAKQEVMLLTHSMAEGHNDIANATRQTLSTLSLFPAIQSKNIKESSEIFRAVLEQNPTIQNITLTALNGDVLVSGLPFKVTNLGDRKHFRDALSNKKFAVGEYIVTRVGKKSPAFPFAYPVLDENGSPIAVLTTAIKLARFSKIHDASSLPEKSFVGVTDHQGIRLFFYPPKATNPVGKPINAKNWNIASQAQEPGIFISEGSDGARRIFAFEQIRLSPGTAPYLYVWAGIPEDHILAPANAALTRNLLLMLLTTALALLISLVIARNTLISPIKKLEVMTRKFAEGNLETGDEQALRDDEFGKLTRAFYDMAWALTITQETLRTNEARIRLVMDSIDALIYVADMNTYEVLFINEYGRDKLGDITGEICWQSLQKGQSGPCSFCTNKYLLDGEGKPTGPYTWEFQNTITGLTFHIKDRAIQWIDGRIVRLEVATDISERILIETKLAQETERLAVTLKSIGDGVITTDKQGLVVLINEVAEKLTGWNSEEAAGRPLTEVFNIVNGKTRLPCENPVGKALASGEIIGLAKDTTLISKTGRKRSIDDSGAPIRNKDGEIVGFVMVFRDITEQIRTEQAIDKMKKIDSIGVLAGGIAHDFNNLLSAILGNIELSLLDSRLTAETQKLLSKAFMASQRATDLTQQLLTFAKGGQPFKETASLPDVVKDSADFILRGQKVVCHYSFPEDLWLVDIDKGQISQVVQNLVVNASHAMPEGVAIKITCENVTLSDNSMIPTLDVGNYIQLSIKDSGVGMPANVLENIFDPYFTTKDNGSGLGLAISLSIINKHLGDILVESTPGTGTTFIIYLPATDKAESEKEETIGTGKPLPEARILIMDDDELVRNVVKEMLTALGQKVDFASEGRGAIKSYEEAMNSDDRFDLVIMDLTIPGGMGGKEAVREILKLDKKAKVVVVSGYNNDPIMANYEDYGFCSAMGKPFHLVELKSIIGQVIG